MQNEQNRSHSDINCANLTNEFNICIINDSVSSQNKIIYNKLIQLIGDRSFNAQEIQSR